MMDSFSNLRDTETSFKLNIFTMIINDVQKNDIHNVLKNLNTLANNLSKNSIRLSCLEITSNDMNSYQKMLQGHPNADDLLFMFHKIYVEQNVNKFWSCLQNLDVDGIQKMVEYDAITSVWMFTQSDIIKDQLINHGNCLIRMIITTW